jgi:ankyrin repeat protein
VTFAASRGHLEAVRVLLPATSDKARRAALTAAAKEGRTAVVTLLLDHVKGGANDALFAAASAAAATSPETVAAIVAHGSTRADAQDGRALLIAARHGRLEVVRLLLAAGVRAAGRGCAARAAQNGHHEVAALLRRV